MTIPATGEPLTDAGPVLTIAQDLFSTMIDGEPGHLFPWMGEIANVVGATSNRSSRTPGRSRCPL